MNPFNNPKAREKWDNLKHLEEKYFELWDASDGKLLAADDSQVLKVSETMQSAIVVGHQLILMLGEIIEMDGAFDGMSDAAISAIKNFHSKLVESKVKMSTSFLEAEEKIDAYRNHVKWALSIPIRRWFVMRHLKKPTCDPDYKRLVKELMIEQIQEQFND